MPQFNKKLGIVRKCDMCSDRLEADEAPACVQACPNEAIAIRVVDTAQIIEDVQADAFLPGAPSPGITLPTTEYKTKRVFPKNTLPADFYNVRPAHNHLPLVVLLVLTQLSVGAFCVDYAVTSFFYVEASIQRYHALIALALGLIALGGSTTHLGRPQYAFRAIMGIGHSWMSREIAGFGAFAGLAVAYAVAVWANPLLARFGLPQLSPAWEGSLLRWLGAAVSLTGLVGVACSVMLYAVTRRAFWKLSQSGPRFFATTLMLGLSLTLLVFTTAACTGESVPGYVVAGLNGALIAACVFKLLHELSIFSQLRLSQASDLKRTALLMRGELARLTQLRFLLAALGGLVLPFLLSGFVDPSAAPARARRSGGGHQRSLRAAAHRGGVHRAQPVLHGRRLAEDAGGGGSMSETRGPRALLSKLMFDRQGTLTRNLLREPGQFGLGQVPERLKPDRTTTVTCGFCSTGCGLSIHLKDGSAVNLSPATDYPVNLGMACPKGWEALAPLAAKDRATTPLRRRKRGEPLEPIDWPTALDEFVQRFKAVQSEHGQESVAFLGTGQITVEELALLGSFAKFGMGIVHGDGNTRQCMATSVVAYKQSFGFDAPPYTYADFEASDVLVFVGANPCIAHPIMWERVCKNKQSPEIIVVDPRKTETAMAATLHLPLAPKSDLVLFYAVANLLIQRGCDRSGVHRAERQRVRGVRGVRRAVHAGASGAGNAARARTDRATGASDRRGQSREPVVDHGREPELRGRAAGAGADQHRAHHRQYRPPRHRRQLDHRAVQRHGFAPVQQHDRFARRPGFHQRRAPRRGGVGARDRRVDAFRRARAGPTIRSWRASCRARSRACGLSPPTRRTPGSTRPTLMRCSPSSTFWSCRTCITRQKPRRLPIWCFRRRAGARRTGSSSTPNGAWA